MVDLIHAINRLENAEKNIDDFIDNNLVVWVEETMLLPTRRLASNAGLSINAQNAITVLKTDFLKAEMVWEYLGADQEPLHEFLENGFDPHNIEAKGKINGGADFLMWLDSAGKPIFRKKVKHPGFGGYHIMADGWIENQLALGNRIVMETKNFLELRKL